MPKQNQTIKSIVDRIEWADSRRVPARLYHPWIKETEKTSYAQLHSAIIDSSGINYFIDTNFFTSHQIPAAIWEALKTNTIVLTPGVWRELTPWRIHPRCNEHLVEHVNSAQISTPAKFQFSELGFSNHQHINAVEYYVNLLCERKRNAVYAKEWFRFKHGRPPDTSELNKLFQKGFADRDVPLLRKGLAEIENARNFSTDEELVTIAALTAILRGITSVILTRDRDVLDQFEKLTALITRQYLATLFAARLAVTKNDWERIAMPRTNATDYYFKVNESYLVKKPVAADDFAKWLLPEEHRPVSMICILLGGDAGNLRMTRLPFIGEVQMRELVDAKCRSDGLNTSALDGKNCHVTGFPQGINNPREYVAITADKFRQATDSPLKYSELDIAQIIYHFEKSVRVL